MNNDASPSSRRSIPPQNELHSSATTGDSNETKTRQRLQQEKRAASLDHLILNLDIMIYLQFSCIYYMDPSLFTLLCRLIPQWIYLTPKSPSLPPFPVTTRPYILLFFALPLLYTIAHIFDNPAVAGEATRYYLHGGVITDFVGQLSPVSKTRLVATDLLVWALQLVMLAVSLERRKIGGELDGAAAAGANPYAPNEEAGLGQAQDAAERGELAGVSDDSSEDIEMQFMNGSQYGGQEAREDPVSDNPASMPRDRHALDSFNSGRQVIAHVDIVDMVRSQWSQRNTFRNVTSESIVAQSNSSSATLATAGRTLGFRFRLGGQFAEIEQ